MMRKITRENARGAKDDKEERPPISPIISTKASINHMAYITLELGTTTIVIKAFHSSH